MPRAKGNRHRVNNKNTACLEISNLEGKKSRKPPREKRKLTITIDSGAAESVVNERTVPQVPTVPSMGSTAGVQYVNANGSRMPNRGEKRVPVLMGDGTPLGLKLQVTDVHRTLLSVGKVCDTGHRVVFEEWGGYIENIATGQQFKFDRRDGVYRMDVELDEESAVFNGPQ